MKFRDVALTIFWRPPPGLQGATKFSLGGSMLGFAVGVLCFHAEQYLWSAIAAAMIGHFAGTGVYLVLVSAGPLRNGARENNRIE